MRRRMRCQQEGGAGEGMEGDKTKGDWGRWGMGGGGGEWAFGRGGEEGGGWEGGRGGV